MPELPEVETVRRGIAPFMEGARMARVVARRKDLRFALPPHFVKRLTGQTVQRLDRRGKYLIAELSGGESLIMHLGMSGRFTIDAPSLLRPGAFAHGKEPDPAHDHIVFEMDGAVSARITYNDPRRFGFMDLAGATELNACRHFKNIGPEPFSQDFTVNAFNVALKNRIAPIKAALLDQRLVAGLGNIYASEALYKARISPRRRAASVAGLRGDRLHGAILDVLSTAIEAGGSSLRDFANPQGSLGYFQHRFEVYNRAGQPCRVCGDAVQRLIQAGRSTFFCPRCQR